MIVVQIFCGLLWTLMVRWSTVIYLHLFLFKTKLPWNHFELWWVWSSLFVVIVPLLVVLILVNAQLRGSFALFLLFAVDFAHGAGCVTFKNPAALQFSGVTLVNTFPAASCSWSKLHRFLNQFFLCFPLLHFSSNLLGFHPMPRSQTTTADDTLINSVWTPTKHMGDVAESMDRPWAPWICFPWPSYALVVTQLLADPLCSQVVVPPFIILYVVCWLRLGGV